jgi:hypothetical protein
MYSYVVGFSRIRPVGRKGASCVAFTIRRSGDCELGLTAADMYPASLNNARPYLPRFPGLALMFGRPIATVPSEFFFLVTIRSTELSQIDRGGAYENIPCRDDSCFSSLKIYDRDSSSFCCFAESIILDAIFKT